MPPIWIADTIRLASGRRRIIVAALTIGSPCTGRSAHPPHIPPVSVQCCHLPHVTPRPATSLSYHQSPEHTGLFPTLTWVLGKEYLVSQLSILSSQINFMHNYFKYLHASALKGLCTNV